MIADINLFGRGGAARSGRSARDGARNHVPQTDRQRLVDSFEAAEDYLHFINQLGINYSTARNIIRVWLQDGRVETQQQGGAYNVVTDAMDEIALTAPFTTLTSMKQQLLERFLGVPISLSTVARRLDGHGISTKIAGKDADFTFERNCPATVERRRPYGSDWQASTSIIG